MDEGQLKAATLMHLRRALKRQERPVITTEFSLGSSSVRADLAILADDFIGIEIKSSADSLRRVQSQLAAYSAYFDRVVLVVAERHLKAVDVDWLCGAALWTFNQRAVIREVSPADSKSDVRAEALFDVLTQNEMRRFAKPTSENNPIQKIAREAFRKAFESRYGQTSAEFWEAVKGRNIKAEDVAALSRFAQHRALQQRNQAEREQFWHDWVRQHERC